MSLVTEGARAPHRLYEFALRTLVQSAKIVVPLAVAVALLSPVLLRLLGPQYVTGASVLLPLLVLSAIPNVVIATFLSAARVQRRMRGGRGRHRDDGGERDGALGRAARPVRAHRRRGRVARWRSRSSPSDCSPRSSEPCGLPERAAAPAAAPDARSAATPPARCFRRWMPRRAGKRPASRAPILTSARSSSDPAATAGPRCCGSPAPTSGPAACVHAHRGPRRGRCPGVARRVAPPRAGRCWRPAPRADSRGSSRRTSGAWTTRRATARFGHDVVAGRAGAAIRTLHAATATETPVDDGVLHAWVDEPIAELRATAGTPLARRRRPCGARSAPGGSP